jgi:cytochrome P450
MFQNKVYEELEGIFQGSDRSPMMKDPNEMKYLERVIKEVLRLYHSVPYIARETTEDIQKGKCEVARILTAEVF